MTSRELKNDRQMFINNIDAFLEKYKDALKKVKSLDHTFSSSGDTLLKNELLSNNELLATNLSNTINNILNEKREVIAKIDAEIRRLEQQEYELLLKKREMEEG